MSVISDIETAAVTAITALGLSPTPTIKAGKTAILPTGAVLPAVRISVGAAGEYEDLLTGKTLAKYPLLVAVYQATSGVTNDGNVLQTWPNLIGRKLNNRDTFSTVTGINEVRRTDLTLFDRVALANLHNADFLRFMIEVIEDTTA